MMESQLILGVLERGRAEGRREARRDHIQIVIRSRLSDPVPEDLTLAIEGTDNEEILKRWFDLALNVADLSEFRKTMKAT